MSTFKKVIKRGSDKKNGCACGGVFGRSEIGPSGRIGEVELTCGSQELKDDRHNLNGDSQNLTGGGVDDAGGVVPAYGIGLTVDEKDIVYTDESVCRMLGIRRRILGEARTKESLGRDWGFVNEEAGMTRRWIEDYALEHGMIADFENENGFVQASGKYVSLRLVGTTPNNCLCLVEVEATGKREYCRIRNIKIHQIHYKEVFSAVRVNLESDRHLEWTSVPNAIKY